MSYARQFLAPRDQSEPNLHLPVWLLKWSIGLNLGNACLSLLLTKDPDSYIWYLEPVYLIFVTNDYFQAPSLCG